MATSDISLRNPGSGNILLTDPASTVTADLGTSTWSGMAASGVPGPVTVTAALAAAAWTGLAASGVPGPVSVTAGLGASSWSGLAASTSTTDPPATDVTGVVIEALVAHATETGLTGAVLEALTAGPTETWVTSVVLEVLGADNIPSVRVAGVVLEVLVGRDPGDIRVTGAVLEVLCGSVPLPLDVPLPTYPDIAEKRFGRDLVLTFPDGEVRPTPTGDWPSVGGRANLHAAMRRRLATTKGQLVHRPDYGADLELFVGELNAPGERARLAAGARRNVLRDPRIGEAGVAVTAPEQGRVVVELKIQPTGEVQTDTVSVVSEG